MPITDLTGTKWQFNDTLTFTDTVRYNVVFTGLTYNSIYISGYQIRLTADAMTYAMKSAEGGLNAISAYSKVSGWNSSSLWNPSSNAPITITGGTDVTNADLIDFLEENATQIVDPSGSLTSSVSYKGSVINTAEGDSIAIGYNGTTIDTITEAGNKVLHTAGKVCISNITVGIATLNCNGKYMEDDITITTTQR